jgi:hypothetical protein
MKMTLVIVQWNKKEDVPLRKVILTMNEEYTYRYNNSSEQVFTFLINCGILDSKKVIKKGCD